MLKDHPKSLEDWPRVLFSRSDFISTAAALALLVGLLATIPVRLMDIFQIFSLCLTGALVMIAFLANSSSELASFPALVVIACVLRMSLNVGCARLIFLEGRGGAVIETLGGVVSLPGGMWAMIICPIAVVVVWGAIYKAAGRIAVKAAKFTSEVIRVKRIGIEADLGIGRIDADQAQALERKLVREGRFYLNMTGVAKFLVCDLAIASVVVLVTAGGQSIITAIGASGGGGGEGGPAGGVLVGGAMVGSLVPVLLLALGSTRLVCANSVSFGGDSAKSEKAGTKVVEVVSPETGQTEEVELLNPDFVEVSVRDPKSGDKEEIASFEPVDAAGATEAASGKEATSAGRAEATGGMKKFDNIDAYYDEITGHIDNLGKEQMPVLFGAESFNDLPVTVAVNVAIRITEKGRSCLIIDADSERNAVARVFDIPPEQIRDKPAETCIEGVSIFSGGDAASRDCLKEAISVSARCYDKVIIYAPDMGESSGSELFTEAAYGAVLFVSAGGDESRLCGLVEQSNCEVLAVMPAISR